MHVGPRRGHVDHWRKTSVLWKIQGGRSPPAGREGGCCSSSCQLVILLLLLLQVGYLSSGKVVALDVSYYSNAGNSMDLSLSVSIVKTSSVSSSADDILMSSPVCSIGHGARSVPHGELVQRGKRTWPWLPVPHQPAVQHRLQGLRRPTRNDGG